MERRVIAAIALSIAILLAFRYYEDRYLPKPVKPPAAKLAEAPQAPQTPAPTTSQEAKTPPAATEPLPAEEIFPERRIVVESALYRAILDNRGAVLTSFQLKNFKTARGEIFDVIPAVHMEQRPYPGSISFDDPALTALANQQNYAVEPATAATTLTAPATVVMRLRRGDLVIEKKYRFEAGNYLVDLTSTITRAHQPVRARILIGQDIGPEAEHLLNPSLQLTAVTNLGGKIQREAAPKNENEIQPVSGDVRWVGLDMQYFALVAVPGQALGSFDMQRIPAKTRDLQGREISRDLLRITIPWDGTGLLKLYLGPKSQPYLAAVPGDNVTGVIDYGTYLGVIVKPLLIALRYLDRFTHNYGWAIILLTFGLTFILFPFRLKQMVSMKKMQVLQPKIKEIQERYKKYKKTDPKRGEMNQEMMALYKQHNVNPLGGCMPLLLQMPFLFAFYRLLSVSIELRHAPFIGWLQDLSAKDPYYVLPIVMGITMLISQKMTPMSPGTDPAQAKMMMIMPVVMTIFFLNVSSGLNLYFLCSNVFQIAFQKVAERWVGDGQPEPRAKNRG